MHWLEDYAFGAVALREEIKRRKSDKTVEKNIITDILLKSLYIYAITVVLLSAPVYMLVQTVCILLLKIKEKFKKTT